VLLGLVSLGRVGLRFYEIKAGTSNSG
jgi:hypothetical protein